MQLDDFVLYRNRIYVPPTLRPKILFEHHDSQLAGHPGRAKTIELIARDYSWPGLSTDIRRYVRSCDLCQRNKSAHHAPYGDLVPLEIPSRNWESVSMDFITDLPTSHGCDTLLVVVDRLSKQAHFIPTIKSLDAASLAQLYISSVFKLHGIPSSIVSDRGSVFTSLFWTEFTTRLGIHLKLSTAYHPQTDGQTERVNQCIEQYLRNFCSYQQDDWVDWTGLAEFQYNNLIHEATRTSPFYANYGFHPSFSLPPLRKSKVPASSNLLHHISIIRSELQAELKLAQEASKRYVDAHRTPAPTFSAGDLVLLSRRNIKTTRPSDKFDYRKIGPFKVLEAIGTNAYRLELPPSLSRLHSVFNINLLEPYSPPSNFPNRLQPPSSVPDIILDDIDHLGLKDILDVRKIGRRFDYFLDFIDKPPTDRAWIPLSDIPHVYDELIERFHRRHSTLPKPTFNALKSKHRLPNPVSSSTNSPTAPIIPSYDPLALPPRPISPFDSERFTYQPPSITTTRSNRKSKPRNLHRVTELITSNQPPRSSTS